ncbi:MAG TPA: retropepsin-like aspartic protease [Terriglobales bacterium]|nr:retropepsin-like aspartic protease [Terriglobales bacterium]
MSQTISNGKGIVEHAKRLFGESSSAHRWTGSSGGKFLSASLLSTVLCGMSVAGDYKVITPPIARHAEEIPFTLYQGYLVVVDGRIGRLEHQHLLIDTGTNPSMIDRNVAAKLGLRGIRGDVATFSDTVPADQVKLSDLEVGPLRRRDLNVMVADFGKVESGVGVHVDAIIGLDVLSTASFTIDFGKRRILFEPSRERHSVPFSVAQQFLQVNLKVRGKQLHLLVDTGTPHLILFNRALHDLDYSRISKSAVGSNLAGGGFYETVVLPEAKLGPESVGPQRVTVVANEKQVEGEYDGLMGVSLLRPKRLSFDFERQVLGWSN